MDYSGSAGGLAATGGGVTLLGVAMPTEQALIVGAALIVVGVTAVVVRKAFRKNKQAEDAG